MLEQVLATVGDGICVLDSNGQTVFVNHKAANLFDKSDTKFAVRITDALKSGSPSRFEYFHPSLQRWFEHQTYPGESGGMTILSRETTARHRLEEALRASEERFQRLIDSNVIGVLVADEEFINEANRSFLETIGYTADDLRKKRIRWKDIELPDYHEANLKTREDVLRTGSFTAFEKEFRRSDGVRVPVTVSGILTRKNPLEALCLVLDLTKTRRAEARVRCIAEASKILESSLDYEETFTALAGFLVKDAAEACHIFVEKAGALRRVAGVSAAGHDQFAGDDLPLDRVMIAGCAVTAGAPMSRIMVPILASGRAAGVLVVMAGARSTYTNEDLQMFEEIGRRAGMALQHALLYNEAQNANRIKDEFVAVVSHELRTPLTPILGGVYMLRTEHHDETVFKHALDLIERNAKSQAKIVEDLLDVSSIMCGKLCLKMDSVDLLNVIRAATDTVRPTANAKSIHIDVRAEKLKSVLLGDADRLQQVIWNLLANAVKFTPAGGVVTLEVSESDRYAEVRVSDTGIGIDAEFLPFVFDRFRQADTSRTRVHGGLGLGLSIVRHLVESHGGTVEVSSKAGEHGSTFTVRLPLRVMAQAAAI